jgi:hypothetical protein
MRQKGPSFPIEKSAPNAQINPNDFATKFSKERYLSMT